MLRRKLNEERQKLREQMDIELSLQRKQMNNMMKANMKNAKQDRELLVQQHQDQQKMILAVQKANEDNLKMIENLSDLVAKQDEEKRRLSEQMELKAQNASERQEKILAEMEKRHKIEKAQLEAKIQDLTKELTAFSGEREQDLGKMLAKFSEQTQALKDQKDIVEKMEAKYLQQQEDLRHEMNEKRETELAKWKSKFQATTETRMQQMRAMQTKIDAVEGGLAHLKETRLFWAEMVKGQGLRKYCEGYNTLDNVTSTYKVPLRNFFLTSTVSPNWCYRCYFYCFVQKLRSFQSFIKTQSIGPAGVRTHDLPLFRVISKNVGEICNKFFNR